MAQLNSMSRSKLDLELYICGVESRLEHYRMGDHTVLWTPIGGEAPSRLWR
jgi:hypothetical protein